MTFRPYAAADRDACMAVFHACVRSEPRYFDPLEEAAFLRMFKALGDGVPAYPGTDFERYWVMQDDSGTIVGCGGFRALSEGNRCLAIGGMLLPRLHGQGHGRALMLHRVLEMRRLRPGCAITLDTTQHTEGFYRRLGFVTVSHERDVYGPGLDRCEMLLPEGAELSL